MMELLDGKKWRCNNGVQSKGRGTELSRQRPAYKNANEEVTTQDIDGDGEGPCMVWCAVSRVPER